MIIRPRPQRTLSKTATSAAGEGIFGEAPPRRSSRAFVRLPARIGDGCSLRECVAFVRDISPTEAFFYAGFTPKYGQHIITELEYWKARDRIRLRLSGRVVRVERPSPTATTGIAVTFDSPRTDIPRRPNQAL